MKLPRVLIFTVTYDGKDYCLDKFLKGLKSINYPKFDHIFLDNSENGQYTRKLKNLGYNAVHVERGANTREALARSQNVARKLAIEQGYDFLMSLESDIIPPENVVQRLISAGKDVVTGLYYIGDKARDQRVPCITVIKFNPKLRTNGTRLLFIKEWKDYYKKGLKQVAAGGFGCCLIHKSIFTKYGFMYDPRFTGHSDIYFFNDLYRNHIPVFVDTNIVCDHDNQPWAGIKNR